MRNLGLASAILAGLMNIDRQYFNSELLAPMASFLWRHFGLMFA